jgi:type I restriction enzyme S subunit
MPDGWRTVALGEIAAIRRRPVTVVDDAEYMRVTLRLRGQGMVRRDRVSGGSLRIKRQFLVLDDDLVVAEIDAKVGGMAVVPLALDGAIVSSHYFAFELASARVLPGWVSLLCESNHFTRQVRAVGSTNYAAVRPAQVLGYTLPLPPLTEQRRIVDLIGSVDITHEQARKTLTSVELTQRAVLLDLFGREPVVWVPLVEVLKDLIGGVWGSPPGEEEVDVAALGLTAFNAPTPRVDRDHSTPRSVNRERWSRRGLRADDIILERSGGTNDRPVGRVIAAQADMLDVIPTDFMRLLRVDPSRAVPRYVFWWLWVRYQRGDTLAFQSKTTNIRNLRVTDYLALPLPMSSRDVQSRVVAVAEELAALTEAALGVVDRLARVRSALLADLLSGEHEIPASYDRFLDGVA